MYSLTNVFNMILAVLSSMISAYDVRSSEPCPVCQEKAIYQEYIKHSEVKQLKTFARLRYDKSVWHLAVSWKRSNIVVVEASINSKASISIWQMYGLVSVAKSNRCRDPLIPKNGAILKEQNNIFNTVEFACSPGYRLVGSKWRLCKPNGRWSGLPPKCEDVDECSPLDQQSYPCHEKADCINTVGSHYCVCRPGYVGDGYRCKKLFNNLLKVQDLCGIVAFHNKSKRYRRIVGGKLAYEGEWPWQAAIYIKRHGRIPFIGGALIKPGWVVTLASLLHYRKKIVSEKDIIVVLGDHDRDKHEFQEQKFRIKRVVVHPKFDRTILSNDIALLQLDRIESRNSFVNSVCLVGGRRARKFEEIGHLATVTGWGTTKSVDIGDMNIGPFSRFLQEANLPLVNRRTCKTATAYTFKPHSMLCAGYTTGSSSPCYGDAGSPLVIQDPLTARWVLLGLYSWSEGCGQPEKFSYFTRVSKFRRWMMHVIRNS